MHLIALVVRLRGRLTPSGGGKYTHGAAGLHHEGAEFAVPHEMGLGAHLHLLEVRDATPVHQLLQLVPGLGNPVHQPIAVGQHEALLRVEARHAALNRLLPAALQDQAAEERHAAVGDGLARAQVLGRHHRPSHTLEHMHTVHRDIELAGHLLCGDRLLGHALEHLRRLAQQLHLAVVAAAAAEARPGVLAGRQNHALADVEPHEGAELAALARVVCQGALDNAQIAWQSTDTSQKNVRSGASRMIAKCTYTCM